ATKTQNREVLSLPCASLSASITATWRNCEPPNSASSAGPAGDQLSSARRVPGRLGPMARLRGKVALVTGASRGGGKGIALVLGEEGATVYVTGRSVRGQPGTLGRPGTIEDTAEQVSARGGTGIAVRCDHADDAQADAVFGRIVAEQGRLDLLVNNAWSG